MHSTNVENTERLKFQACSGAFERILSQLVCFFCCLIYAGFYDAPSRCDPTQIARVTHCNDVETPPTPPTLPPSQQNFKKLPTFLLPCSETPAVKAKT